MRVRLNPALQIIFAAIMVSALLGNAQDGALNNSSLSSSNEVKIFGFSHSSIGQAELSIITTPVPGSSGLKVGNLSSSGNDGVSIHIDDRIPSGSDFTVFTPSLDMFSHPPVGGTIQYTTLHGNQVTLNASFTVQDQSTLGANLDLTPLNQPITAEIYKDGQLFEVISGLPGLMQATMTEYKKVHWDNKWLPPCITIIFGVQSADFFSNGNLLFSLPPGTYQIFLGAPVDFDTNTTRVDVTSTLPEILVTNENCSGMYPGCLPSTTAK